MINHNHLLFETPDGNLSIGLRRQMNPGASAFPAACCRELQCPDDVLKLAIKIYVEVQA